MKIFTNIIKYVLLFTVILFSFYKILEYCTPNSIIYNLLIGVPPSLFVTGLSGIYAFLKEMPINRYKLPLLWRLCFPILRKKQIRVSMAYLYAINVYSENTDFYVGIYNENSQGTIQPVGGVYKYYGKPTILREIEAEHDAARRKGPDDTEYDLRLKFKLKHFQKFMKWFDSAFEREWNVLRELREEIFNNKLLSKESFDFENLQIEKIDSFDNFYGYHHKGNYYLFRHFDIFYLRMTPEQQELLKESCKQHRNRGKRLVTVTLDEIIDEKTKNGTIISGNMLFVTSRKKDLHKKAIFKNTSA
ncbi:MAG: hypothetical protein QM644_03505 [Mobilitalea sp.]